MKFFFSNFWLENEKIRTEPFWKHLFKYCNFETCDNEEEADVSCYSVFFVTKESLLYCKKKLLFFTGEPLAVDSDLFTTNLSFHVSEYKNVILFPPFLFSMFNTEIPRTISIKSLPKVTEVPQKFCCFMYKMHYEERVNFFHELSKYKKVDSIGPLLNNTGFEAPFEHDKFISIISQYKFIICFENTKIERYITEKILHAYYANIVPIYWGSEYVDEFFNKDRIVLIEDYTPENVEKAIEQIKELDNNDELYLQTVNKPVFNEHFDPDEYFQSIQKALPDILQS